MTRGGNSSRGGEGNRKRGGRAGDRGHSGYRNPRSPKRNRAQQAHIKPGMEVTLLHGDGKMKVGMATVFGDGEGLLYMNHGADVRTVNRGCEVCLVWRCTFEQNVANLPYEYEIPHNEEQPRPTALRDMISGFRYAWGTNMMVPKVDEEDREKKVSTEDPKKMEVVEEASSQPDSLTEVAVKTKMSKLYLRKYKRRIVHVNINEVVFSENSVRDVDEEHVDDLATSVSENGLLYSSGTIAVTSTDENVLKDVDSHVKLVQGEQRFSGALRGLDGVHRCLALGRVKDMVEPEEKDRYIWIQAELWCRPDLKPMSDLEIISIGTNLNATSSKVRKSSFQDNVHSTMSCVRILLRDDNKTLEQMDRLSLVSSMKSLNTLPGVSENQYAKYANIAIAFVRNDIPSKVFKRYPKVSLAHSSNETFLRNDRPCMFLSLECVNAYLETAAPKGQKKGAFDEAGDSFYDCVRELYAQTRVLATKRNMDVEALLDTEVPLTSMNTSKRRKVHEIIGNNMATFLKKDVAKMRQKQVARLATLRKCVGFMAISSSTAAQNTATDRATDATRKAAPGEAVASSQPEAVPAPPQAGAPAGAVEAPENTILPPGQPSLRRSQRTKQKRGADVSVASVSMSPALSRAKKGKKKVGNKKRRIGRTQKVREPEVISSDEHEDPPHPEKEEEESDGEQGGEAKRKQVSSFDDSLPALLPVGYNDPPAWKGPKRPGWVFKAAMPPTMSVEIPHVSPWLEFLFIPRGHRAHVMCKSEDLNELHEQTFFRGAVEWFRQNWTRSTPYFDGDPTNGDGASDARNERYEQLAKQHHWLSAAYFAEQGVKLEELGYCVFRNFVLDVGKNPGVSKVTKLMDYFLSSFPGEEKLKDPGNRDLWNPICNAADSIDEEDRKRGVGRIMTTLEGASVHVEQEEDLVWVARERALLDVRIANILGALRVVNKGTEALKTPRSGGRFLYTSKGCRRQRMHTDFEVNRNRSKDESPGYFVVVTGRTASPLWVVPRSNSYAKLPAKTCKMLSAALHPVKVVIPPFSVFIGRGDLLHAGPAHNDYGEPPTDGGLRYHMYFVPHDLRLVDGIHQMPDLNPPYLEEDLEVPPSAGTAGGIGDETSRRGTAGKEPVQVVGKKVKIPVVEVEEEDYLDERTAVRRNQQYESDESESESGSSEKSSEGSDSSSDDSVDEYEEEE